MTQATTIRSLSIERLDIPLQRPFGMLREPQGIVQNLLVCLELADGTCGYGEAAPFPDITGETQEATWAALEEARSLVEGGNVREWRAISQRLRGPLDQARSALCAIEMALLDALTRSVNLPLWAFFGGASQSLETDMTVTTGTVSEATAQAQAIISRGISTIKIKVGTGKLALDLERIEAVHTAAPSAPLILDGDGRLNADEALQLLSTLHIGMITPILFEQPVGAHELNAMRQVAKWGGVPVAADESVTCASDVYTIASLRAAHVVSIKLMRSGIVEALDIAAAARTSNLQLMISSLRETILGTSVAACFAAGLGGFSYVDLDTPIFLAQNPFQSGLVRRGSMLDLSAISAGHGVTPRTSTTSSS
jgi:L-alanine-DL-glutamate epimerase-like enolase superfamily enzyme